MSTAPPWRALSALLGVLRAIWPINALHRAILGMSLRRLGKGSVIDKSVRFVRPDRVEIGSRVTVWPHTVVYCGGEESVVSIGDRTTIDQGVIIKTLNFDADRETRIVIGEGTLIGPYTCVWGPGDIRIGDECLISSHCSVVANSHVYADPEQPINSQGIVRSGITIEDDCWLGNGVSVMDGVTIGEGSIIGAGAVVVRDLPPRSIAVGVPARVVDRRAQRHRKT